MMPARNDRACAHCGQQVDVSFYTGWVHAESRSVWCDLSATTRAFPVKAGA